MRIRNVAAALAAVMLIGGCSDSATNDAPDVGPTDPTSGNGAPPPPPAGVGSFKPLFVVSNGVFPYPVDFYFSLSTDGTLNVPATVGTAFPNRASINKLDGFSTSSPMTARFSAPINPATITPASVIVLEVDVDNATKATIGFRRPLVFGVDYEARTQRTGDTGFNPATGSGTTLEIVPLKPLTPSSGATNVGYLVILTNGLRDIAGNAATPDADYQRIKAALPTCASLTGTINGICRLTGAHLQIAGAVGVNPANVVLTFSFSTQSTVDSLNILSALAQPAPIAAESLGVTVLEASGGLVPGPNSDLYAGEITLPYYLSPPTTTNPAAPLSVNWLSTNPSPIDSTGTSFEITRFNPVPKKLTDVTVPLLIGVPNGSSPWCGAPPCAKPANGWPVALFFPGFTRTRTDMLPVANAYASAGFVVVAMDHPLHGMPRPADKMGYDNVLVQLPLTDLIYVPWDPATQTGERTFDVDYLNNTTGLPPSDGIPDPSGGNSFPLMLQNPVVFRDLIRQAAIDFVVLAKSLGGLDLDGDGTGDVDTSRVHLSGHSGGAIIGTVTSALDVPLNSAYLNAAGGKVVYSLFNSTRYGPIFRAILQSQGIPAGTTLYENVIRNSQTSVDAGDPFNFVAQAAAARPIVLTVIKDDANVTNEASLLLATAANLQKASAAGPALVAPGAGRYVFFLEGGHGSLLGEPAGFPTVEMQTHAVSLVLSGGAAFQITPAGSAILEP
jgi:hypothetical protein